MGIQPKHASQLVRSERLPRVISAGNVTPTQPDDAHSSRLRLVIGNCLQRPILRSDAIGAVLNRHRIFEFRKHVRIAVIGSYPELVGGRLIIRVAIAVANAGTVDYVASPAIRMRFDCRNYTLIGRQSVDGDAPRGAGRRRR